MSSKVKNDYEALAYMLMGGVGCLALAPTYPFLLGAGALATVSSLGLAAYEIIENRNGRLWENIGLMTKDEKIPLCIKTIKSDLGEQKVYNLPNGLSYKKVVEKQPEIESSLKSRVKIELAENYRLIITKISKRYEGIYKIDLKENLLDGMKLHLGKDLQGRPIVLDLSGNEMHTGVFGSTGSGKSVCLNIIMAQLILKDVAVSIIDLKGGVEFAMYRRYNKLRDMAITADDATRVLCDMVETMNKRYKLLYDAECKNYKDYNDARGNKMPPLVLIIDEYNVLMGNEFKDAHKALFELLSRARACNIICIICTQRPSHEVLPGTLKCNIKNFITFKVENETDSEIVLSQKGNYRAFNELCCEGEGLIKSKGKIVGFKGYYLTDEEILSQVDDKLSKRKAIQPTVKGLKVSTTTKDDILKIDSLI